MTGSILNLNISQQYPAEAPTPVPFPRLNKKVDVAQMDDYEGSFWTNAPNPGNVFYAFVETALATGTLVRAIISQDKEGQFDASLRLIEQPLSFCGAIGSLMMTITEVGLFFKLFNLSHFLPQLSAAVSGFGLALCTLELFFESIGLSRMLSFQSKFYYSSQPEFPNFSESGDPAKLKEKIIQWAERLIESPKSLQASFSATDSETLFLQLRTLINNLQADQIPLSEAGIRSQIEQFLQRVNEQLIVADLKHLHRRYFSVFQDKADKIRLITQDKFPELSESELNVKQDELIGKLLTSKRSNLARRVQCWFVRELDEKLQPLIEKLSHPNLEVRSQARIEAQELFKTMDIQVKKKIIVHTIGIIAITILGIGLILGLTACPYLIPAVLVTVGGGLVVVRFLLAKGFWHKRGWHFDAFNCLAPPIKWAYGKLVEANRVSAEINFLPPTPSISSKRRVSLVSTACENAAHIQWTIPLQSN